MKVQYLFNLQGTDQCGSQTKMSPDDLHKKLKQAFFTQGREYNLDKNWRDH